MLESTPNRSVGTRWFWGPGSEKPPPLPPREETPREELPQERVVVHIDGVDEPEVHQPPRLGIT